MAFTGRVLNTYRVRLRYELFRNRLGETAYQASEECLGDFLEARGNTKPHLAELEAPRLLSINAKALDSVITVVADAPSKDSMGSLPSTAIAANAPKDSLRPPPSTPVGFLNRGDIYFARSEYDCAIQDCDEAIRLNPKYARAFYSRALAKRNPGDAVGGDLEMEAAKTIDPYVGMQLLEKDQANKVCEYQTGVIRKFRLSEWSPNGGDGSKSVISYYEKFLPQYS